jgi:predicted nucleic acid-binding protein
VIVYLDTSVVLRVLFAQPDRLPEWSRWDEAYTSELTGVETRRAVDRLRLEHALEDEGVAEALEGLALIEATLGIVPLTRPVLQRASLPMPTFVRTLDALHVASALLLRERRSLSLAFATHDRHQHLAARALGFESIGV